MIIYTGDVVPGAENRICVYNAAPTYIELRDSNDPANYNVIPNASDLVAGATIYVHFQQAIPATVALQYKTFWQASASPVTADDQAVTVQESVWFYADYPDYGKTGYDQSKIWEGNWSTRYFTVTHKYSVDQAKSVLTIPFLDGVFDGTRPYFTYRVIHLSEDGYEEQFVKVADKHTMAVEELIRLRIDPLEPGMYYLTMISDDGQFGFVNYKFIVEEPDYRVGLTWDSEATGAGYAAWVAEINGGRVAEGDIIVDGYEILDDYFDDGITPYRYINYYDGILSGKIEATDIAGKYNRPIGILDLTLNTSLNVDTSHLTALIPRYVIGMGTADEVTYRGNDTFGAYLNEADIKGTYASSRAVTTLNFDESSTDFMEPEEHQALTIIRATNDAITESDAKDCIVTVYYLSTPDSGISRVNDVSFTVNVGSDEYYDTVIFSIDDILNGSTVEGTPITADPDADWILTYEIMYDDGTDTLRDALNIYEA